MNYLAHLFENPAIVSLGMGAAGGLVVLLSNLMHTLIAGLKVKAAATPTKVDDVALDVADKVIGISTDAVRDSLNKK